MGGGRAFLVELLEGCKNSGWSARPKDKGFIVSPPPNKRRPGFETIYIWACNDNHDQVVLLRRLKQAGLNVNWEEREVTMPKLDTVAPPGRPKEVVTEVVPDESTIQRIRRKVNAIADMCADVVVDLDSLEKEREQVAQLKALLKQMGS